MPDSNNFKSTRQLERQYGLSNGLIGLWIKKGWLPPETISPERGPRGAVLVDEAAVRAIATTSYKPQRATTVRPAVVLDELTQAQIVIPAHSVKPRDPLSAAIPTGLPAGTLSTAELVTQYLAQRQLAVDRGTLSEGTVTVERSYLRKWALATPLCPWSQADISRYDTSLGVMKSRWHHMRYLKAFTLWLIEQRPELEDSLPKTKAIKVGKQKPPRPEVLTPDDERKVMDALRKHDYPLWLYAYTLTHTGCRGFELRDLEWSELTPAGFLTKGRAKKRAGPVYFPPGLYDSFEQLPQPHTGFVFTTLGPGDSRTSLNRQAHRDGERETPGSGMPAHKPASHRYFNHRLTSALRKAGLPDTGGFYRYRHLFAERMKDRINIERLATIMRTSVAQLENTYGKHSDNSFLDIVAAAHADVWGKPGEVS